MQMTEQDAKDCQYIVNRLSTKGAYPAYPNVICGELFANQKSAAEVQRLFSLISTCTPKALDHKVNGTQTYVIRNPNTHIFAQTNGIIEWYKKNIENSERQIISDAKMWYETESAKRMFEDYEINKSIAKKARCWAILAVIISGLVLIVEVLKWTLQPKS